MQVFSNAGAPLAMNFDFFVAVGYNCRMASAAAEQNTTQQNAAAAALIFNPSGFLWAVLELSGLSDAECAVIIQNLEGLATADAVCEDLIFVYWPARLCMTLGNIAYTVHAPHITESDRKLAADFFRAIAKNASAAMQNKACGSFVKFGNQCVSHWFAKTALGKYVRSVQNAEHQRQITQRRAH